MSRDITYIKQIFETIEKIEEYTKDGQSVFIETAMIQDAVIRNIEVIG